MREYSPTRNPSGWVVIDATDAEFSCPPVFFAASRATNADPPILVPWKFLNERQVPASKP
jgi:hypothetical protein